jgi:NADH:ubiquinone oxidoreductase subunit 6 (subunit J)
LLIGYGLTNSDLVLEKIELNQVFNSNNQTGIIQWTTPRINITVKNNGPDILQFTNTTTGFIICREWTWPTWPIVFNSSYIWEIYIAVWWFWIRNNLQLNQNLTNTLTQKTITCVVDATKAGTVDTIPQNNGLSLSFNIFTAPTGRFDLALDRSIESIQQNLDPAEAALGTDGIINFIRKNIVNLVIPLVIIVGVIVAIIWFYKMMLSDSEESSKEWLKYIIRWVIGIIVMMSSWYLASSVLFENIFDWWDIQTFNWIQVAWVLYNQAIFPFIKIAMYLAMGILFIILATRVLQYLTNPSEDIKKQAITLIIWNIIGILIILWSKQIVELVFWSETQVMDQSAQDLGDIWTGILSGNLPILYTIINRVMWLAAFIILVIIILQTYQLLVNPNNEENMSKIKKSFLYIAIGIIVIGAGYVITNFLIIN